MDARRHLPSLAVQASTGNERFKRAREMSDPISFSRCGSFGLLDLRSAHVFARTRARLNLHRSCIDGFADDPPYPSLISQTIHNPSFQIVAQGFESWALLGSVPSLNLVPASLATDNPSQSLPDMALNAEARRQHADVLSKVRMSRLEWKKRADRLAPSVREPRPRHPNRPESRISSLPIEY